MTAFNYLDLKCCDPQIASQIENQNLKEENQNLKEVNQNLKEENSHLRYAYGGEGFQKALDDYQKYIKK